jgi:hypothetical protein
MQIMYIYIHTHIYIHICTYTHVDTYIHTHINTYTHNEHTPGLGGSRVWAHMCVILARCPALYELMTYRQSDSNSSHLTTTETIHQPNQDIGNLHESLLLENVNNVNSKGGANREICIRENDHYDDRRDLKHGRFDPSERNAVCGRWEVALEEKKSTIIHLLWWIYTGICATGYGQILHIRYK